MDPTTQPTTVSITPRQKNKRPKILPKTRILVTAVYSISRKSFCFILFRVPVPPSTLLCTSHIYTNYLTGNLAPAFESDAGMR
jgi:hypothetical protein